MVRVLSASPDQSMDITTMSCLAPLISQSRRLLLATCLLAASIGTGRATPATSFVTPSTFVNYATGTAVPAPLGGTASVGSIYSDAAPSAVNGIFPVTFGQSFTVSASGTAGGGTAALGYQGNISGASILASTVMPISYNFTVGKNEGIIGAVDWVLYFRGGTNAEVQVASGTLADAGAFTATSANFSGNASSYTFTSGATNTDNYRAYIGISYGNNVGAMLPGVVSVTMNDTGFQGQGITLNATSPIPEPSTYAAIFGGIALLGVIVQRRRRQLA
jgi:hypothetical protein